MSNLVSLEKFKIEKILKKIALATENYSSEAKTGGRCFERMGKRFPTRTKRASDKIFEIVLWRFSCL